MLSQREYIREMALSLMMSVGLDDAIDQALRNHWQGVLAELLSMPRLPTSKDPDPQKY